MTVAAEPFTEAELLDLIDTSAGQDTIVAAGLDLHPDTPPLLLEAMHAVGIAWIAMFLMRIGMTEDEALDYMEARDYTLVFKRSETGSLSVSFSWGDIEQTALSPSVTQ